MTAWDAHDRWLEYGPVDHEELIAAAVAVRDDERRVLAALVAERKAGETQQDRCSDQRHLWRRHERFGIVYMACQCGAVHPDDYVAFMETADQ